MNIEVIHCKDTDLFLNGLRRLISRRGRPKEMRSDNRTHFVRGNRELQEALLKSCEDKIDKFLQRQEIYRKPNSPKASHMGGLWQRVICSARKIMNAMVHEQVMDDEGLQTLMCEVESILNGRPLTKFQITRKRQTPCRLIIYFTGTSRYEKSPSEKDLIIAVLQRDSDSRQVKRIVKVLDGTYRDEFERTLVVEHGGRTCR